MTGQVSMGVISVALVVVTLGLVSLAVFSSVDLLALCAAHPDCPQGLPRQILHTTRTGAPFEVAVTGLLWGVSAVFVLLLLVTVGVEWAATPDVWAGVLAFLGVWVAFANVAFFRRRLGRDGPVPTGGTNARERSAREREANSVLREERSVLREEHSIERERRAAERDLLAVSRAAGVAEAASEDTRRSARRTEVAADAVIRRVGGDDDAG